MATQATGLSKGKQDGNRGTPLTWTLSILAVVVLLISGYALFFATATFANMYASMGVDLPLPTRMILGIYRFGYPCLFGGTAVLVIAKQFLMREKWANVSATLAAITLVGMIGMGIIWALYFPLQNVMEKLSK